MLARRNVRTRAIVLAALSGGLTLVAPHAARACKCLPPPPTFIVGPILLDSQGNTDSTSKFHTERVELDCTRGLKGTSLECDWSATYAFDPDAHGKSETLHVVLALGRSEAPRVLIDGASVVAAPLLASELESTAGLPIDAADASFHRIDVPATEEVIGLTTLTVTGTVQVETDICECEGPGVERRHPVVPQPESFGASVVYYSESGPSPGLPVELVVKHGRPVRVRGHEPEKGDREQTRVDLASGETRGWTQTRIELSRRANGLPGGPLVAVGLGLDPRPAFRMRVGWEAAAPVWLAHSLALESDVRSHAEIVYDLQAVSRYGRLLGILPSAGIGVGLPVQVAPSARPGVRAALSLSWGPVHLYGSFDYFPTLGQQEPFVRGGVCLGGSI